MDRQRLSGLDSLGGPFPVISHRVAVAPLSLMVFSLRLHLRRVQPLLDLAQRNSIGHHPLDGYLAAVNPHFLGCSNSDPHATADDLVDVHLDYSTADVDDFAGFPGKY
jgi:hypothetical protein